MDFIPLTGLQSGGGGEMVVCTTCTLGTRRVLGTLLHVMQKTPPRCTAAPEMAPSIRCPGWRYHQLGMRYQMGPTATPIGWYYCTLLVLWMYMVVGVLTHVVDIVIVLVVAVVLSGYERRTMSMIHNRDGPVCYLVSGIGQPVADGGKLLAKSVVVQYILYIGCLLGGCPLLCISSTTCITGT